jgi:hypothetical protein
VACSGHAPPPRLQPPSRGLTQRTGPADHGADGKGVRGVGIDVCKDCLDVHAHPTNRSFRVPDNRDGLKQLQRRLADLEVGIGAAAAEAMIGLPAQLAERIPPCK